MKIGIIGAGTASAIAMLTFVDFIRKKGEYVQVTCISDPTKPTIQVGESTSGIVYDTMREVLGIDFAEDLDAYDGTLRYYTRYMWEEANGKDFSVFYHTPGLHLNSEKWSRYVIDKLVAKYSYFFEISDEILSIDQTAEHVVIKGRESEYEFDYLVDCRGTPTAEELDSDAYETDVFETVNSVILFPHFKPYNENNTFAYVHKNGWMFGVPLQHRKAFGYLYNNKITSYEEAAEHFAELKGIDTSTLRKFSWRPYHKKKALDGRILSIGNRLYLLEPQQAIPLHYYALLARTFITGILMNVPTDRLNEGINEFNTESLQNIQNLMALSYVGPNNIDSPFWNTLKEKSRKHLIGSDNFQKWLSTLPENEILGYAPIDSSMLKSYLKGFNIDLNSLKRTT